MDVKYTIYFIAILLMIGAVILIPSLWIVRRKQSKLPEDSDQRKKITSLGVIFVIIQVSLLMIAFNLKYIIPESSFIIRVSAIAFVILLAYIIEKKADSKGVKLFK